MLKLSELTLTSWTVMTVIEVEYFCFNWTTHQTSFLEFCDFIKRSGTKSVWMLFETVNNCNDFSMLQTLNSLAGKVSPVNMATDNNGNKINSTNHNHVILPNYNNNNCHHHNHHQIICNGSYSIISNGNMTEKWVNSCVTYQ